MSLARLINTFNKNKLFFFWLTILLSFLLVGGTEQLITLFIISTYGFFILGFNVLDSCFLSLILSIPFRMLLVGSKISVVLPQSEKFLSGYSYYFGLDFLSIYFLLVVLLLLFVKQGRNILINLKKFSLTYITGFFFFASISIFFAQRIDLAISGYISLTTSFGLYYLGIIFFQNKRIRKQFSNFLIALLLLLGIVGTTQLIFHHSLGLYIEAKSISMSSEFLTTDGTPLYRVIGIMPHPTFFASTLSLLLLSVLGIFIKAFYKKEKLVIGISGIALILGAISLFATFSRSGWFSFFVGVSIFLFFILKINKKLIKNFLIILTLGITSLIILASVSPIFMLRLQSFKTVWSVGNWQGRIELMKHSWHMIREKPWQGVGVNHFTKVMVEQGVVAEHRGFIFPVHNTFLLFASELGLPAGISFIVFVIFTLYKSFSLTQNNLINLGIWIALISFVVNAQFHTLFNQDPTFNLFMILSAYLMSQKRNEVLQPNNPSNNNLSSPSKAR